MSNRKNNIVIGFRAIEEAVKAGKDFQKVFFKKGLKGMLFKELFALVKQKNIPFQFVPIEKLNKISGKNHQGVIAMISPIEFVEVDKLLPMIYEQGKDPFILILDGVTDIHNFGAIARTAECAGVDAIIIPSKGAAAINADALKISAGALHYIPVCRSDNLLETAQYLKNSGLKMIAASEKAKNNLYDSNYNTPLALILGAEETGVSDKLQKLSDQKIKIPLYGEISSLNVSVAASVFIYEIVRQRIRC